jgi:hypothetical protein
MYFYEKTFKKAEDICILPPLKVSYNDKYPIKCLVILKALQILIKIENNREKVTRFHLKGRGTKIIYVECIIS